MRTRVLSILIIVLVVAGFASAYDHRMHIDQQPLSSNSTQESDGKVVDLKADVVYPININGDSTVYCLVGNFVAHHNGAVIVCDSAVRYSDKRIECFGNVLINQGTTYIYGDRAEYNGDINEAEVHSPLVKVVDGDVTLYTYKFRFNTLESIGTFSDGGIVTKEDNMLESDRGYFYSNSDQIICVEKVQMTNNEYQMTGDSVIYNINTDQAHFFTRTNIWNDKGEYLYADQGLYDKENERYVITKNGYILTENEEIWSDSLDYYRVRGYGLMRHDIQLDDRSHKMIAFGDWGEYWKEPGNALLTRNPASISYDPEQGDSVFMRADTMILYSRSTQGDRAEKERQRIADSIRDAQPVAPDSLKGNAPDSTATPAVANKDTKVGKDGKNNEKSTRRERGNRTDKEKGKESDTPDTEKTKLGKDTGERTTPLANAESRLPSAEKSRKVEPGADSLSLSTTPADSIAATAPDTLAAGDSLAMRDSLELDSLGRDSLKTPVMTAADSLAARLDTLPKAERKALLKEIALRERERVKKEQKRLKDSVARVKAKIQKDKLDSIGEVRQQKRNVMLDKLKAREDTLIARARAREEARKLKMIARLTKKGVKFEWADSVARAKADSTLYADMNLYDSIYMALYNSIVTPPSDSIEMDATVVDTAVVDTAYRLMLGYRNVRIYRSDFQAVCDSLSSSSLDSVIRMYIAPILWHQQNQVTSDVVDMYTSNQQITRAEFSGKPMMTSKIDTLHFNQVAGKRMISHFRNNYVYRNDVDGNAQTIYYMQEEGSPEVQGLMYIESADMTFYIEDQTVSGITYRGSPTYTIYPMDKIPETQPLFLDGFAWHDDKRPARDSVLTRSIRPSVRTEKEALQRPQFPISKRIADYRTRLTDRKEWRDRNDILTQEVIEWLETQTDWREQTEKNQRQRDSFGKEE